MAEVGQSQVTRLRLGPAVLTPAGVWRGLPHLEEALQERDEWKRRKAVTDDAVRTEVKGIKCGCQFVRWISKDGLQTVWMRIQSPSGEVYEGTPPTDKGMAMWGRLISSSGCWYEGGVQDFQFPAQHSRRCKDISHQEFTQNHIGEHEGCKFFFAKRHTVGVVEGVQECPGCCRYEGPWKNDKKHTSETTDGLLQTLDGQRSYKGKWHQGKRQGRGKEDREGRYSYQGEYQDNYWKQGTVTYPIENVKFEGSFRPPRPDDGFPDTENGVREGYGIEWKLNQERFIAGWYQNGMPQGKVFTRYRNQDLIYAEFQTIKKLESSGVTRSSKNGKAVAKYSSGAFYVGNFFMNFPLDTNARITFDSCLTYEGGCLGLNGVAAYVLP